MPKFYTISDIAELTGISVFVIRKWRVQGRIPKGKLAGTATVYTESERDKIMRFASKWPVIKSFEKTKQMKEAWEQRYEKALIKINEELTGDRSGGN